MIYLFIIAILLSAASKAVMDAIQFGQLFSNKGQWWNPDTSWKLKWKNGNPSEGEKFPGSSTIFVRFTDGFHFFQGLFLTFMFTAMVLYPHAIDTSWSWWILLHFAGIYAVFTGSFEIIYRLLTPKK